MVPMQNRNVPSHRISRSKDSSRRRSTRSFAGSAGSAFRPCLRRAGGEASRRPRVRGRRVDRSVPNPRTTHTQDSSRGSVRIPAWTKKNPAAPARIAPAWQKLRASAALRQRLLSRRSYRAWALRALRKTAPPKSSPLPAEALSPRS